MLYNLDTFFEGNPNSYHVSGPDPSNFQFSIEISNLQSNCEQKWGGKCLFSEFVFFRKGEVDGAHHTVEDVDLLCADNSERMSCSNRWRFSHSDECNVGRRNGRTNHLRWLPSCLFKWSYSSNVVFFPPICLTFLSSELLGHSLTGSIPTEIGLLSQLQIWYLI